MQKIRRFFILLSVVTLTTSACMRLPNDSSGKSGSIENKMVEKPELPERLELNDKGIPELDVYNTETDQVEEMDIETYVAGVVAGEMKNDWPMEALKAQSILARTFVLKFCDDKTSAYDDADISTDVREAQAYAPENINDRIRQAVQETEGTVMSSNGDSVHAWFFAHAAGRTELPSVALDFKEADPSYLSSVESPDSDQAPESVQQWTATFTKEEIKKACADAGVLIDTVDSVQIGEKGVSGRAKTLLINGKTVSAPTFRIAIGANELKSTLLDGINVTNGEVEFHGRGFGHGVGMSQWGAYQLAEDGSSAEEIVQHYFQGIDLVKLW
ncbi:MAG: SpoIID/LytB domain-containing protein [Christensenellales bacterium]|nr:SpoIID/LytB domain-containing protein [Christensenellales bacterium]